MSQQIAAPPEASPTARKFPAPQAPFAHSPTPTAQHRQQHDRQHYTASKYLLNKHVRASVVTPVSQKTPQHSTPSHQATGVPMHRHNPKFRSHATCPQSRQPAKKPQIQAFSRKGGRLSSTPSLLAPSHTAPVQLPHASAGTPAHSHLHPHPQHSLQPQTHQHRSMIRAASGQNPSPQTPDTFRMQHMIQYQTKHKIRTTVPRRLKPPASRHTP